MKKTLAALSIAVITAVVAPSAASAVSADGEWFGLGSGLSSAITDNVYDVVEGPDGNVYVTGCFENAGGVGQGCEGGIKQAVARVVGEIRHQVIAQTCSIGPRRSGRANIDWFLSGVPGA